MHDTFLITSFLLFCFLSLLLYYRMQYWRDERARVVLWWTVAALALMVVAKYAIRSQGRGYVPDRTLLYAVPVARLDGLPFILLVLFALGGVALWYRLKHRWPPWLNLTLLWFLFVVFAVGVGGLRAGAESIALPFMRVDMEYIGDARLIQNPAQFLRDYVSLIPRLSLHGKEHPPGNALAIYALQTLLQLDTLGLAVLITMIGGTIIFPVFYFWRRYIPEPELENMMPVFMLTPSIAMFASTSMDIVSPPVFWTALLVSAVGWRHSSALAFAGGIIGGVALLLNFLFLAFGMVLLFFFIRTWLARSSEEYPVLIARGFLTVAGMVLFLAALYALTNYSIVENFLTAFAVHHGVVKSGASSATTYLIFGAINIGAFFLYLGLVHAVVFVRDGRRIVGRASDKWLVLCGFLIVGIFVLSGVFQGEVERIWLFLTPLFLPLMVQASKVQQFPHGAAIALLSFQIIVIETLFHTYW